MLKPGGCMTETFLNGKVVECDTFTCAHNNEIVKVPPGTDPYTIGAFCRQCMKHICEKCAAEMERTLKCIPFERRLERSESRDRLYRQILGQ